MADIETPRKRRCAHRATTQSSTTPVRQNFRVLHFANGQGGGRGACSSCGFVLRHKRPSSSGKFKRVSFNIQP